jgi:hypothetical protein
MGRPNATWTARRFLLLLSLNFSLPPQVGHFNVNHPAM